MKIKQAPVADLLKYTEELYEEKKKQKFENILQVVSLYYSKLTNYNSIMPMYDAVLEDWCDLNFSNTMKNCPNVPGIIVYKNSLNGARKYALLYHSGYIMSPDKQTNFLSYFDINQHGHVDSHTYNWKDWDGWGAPLRYFYFSEKDYIDSSKWALGERVLELDSFGHDVRMLQSFLRKAHIDVPLHGYFDEKTEQALKDTQIWINLEPNGIFDFENGGKNILDFLTNKQQSLAR